MLLVIFFLFSFRAIGYRPEEGNITANVGPYFFKSNFEGSSSKAKSPFMPGLGLVVNGDINTKGALEIGVFHMNKRFVRSHQKNYISEMTQVIHITMGYRWWLSEYNSASLSLYSAYPMGNVKIKYSDFPKGSEIRTSARDTTEYGFDLASQWQIWKGNEFDMMAELRYSISATSRDHEKSDHYGGFIGVRYLIQEKNPDKKPDKKKFD